MTADEEMQEFAERIKGMGIEKPPAEPDSHKEFMQDMSAILQTVWRKGVSFGRDFNNPENFAGPSKATPVVIAALRQVKESLGRLLDQPQGEIPN